MSDPTVVDDSITSSTAIVEAPAKAVTATAVADKDAATPLPKAEPPARTRTRAVIFLLSRDGHRRFYSDFAESESPNEEAQEIFELSKKWAQVVKDNSPGDPIDVKFFDSLNEFVGSSPDDPQARWKTVWIMTHGFSGKEERGGTPELFFGSELYSPSDLDAFMTGYPPQITSFRGMFDQSSELRIVACEIADLNTSIGVKLRELIGTKGPVIMPKAYLNFNASGQLGVPIDLNDVGGTLRPIRADDFVVLPSIP